MTRSAQPLLTQGDDIVSSYGHNHKQPQGGLGLTSQGEGNDVLVRKSDLFKPGAPGRDPYLGKENCYGFSSSNWD